MDDLLRENVARGAKLLDEKHPDWTHELDLDILDTSSPQGCPLGQTVGWYNRADIIGHDTEVFSAEQTEVLIRHGFEAVRDESAEFDIWKQYEIMDRAWREEAEARRQLPA